MIRVLPKKKNFQKNFHSKKKKKKKRQKSNNLSKGRRQCQPPKGIVENY